MHARHLTVFVVAAAVLHFAAPVGAVDVEDLIDQVTLAEYQSYLRVLTGVDVVPGHAPHSLTNRYSFGADIHVAAAWMHAHFDGLGLETSFHEFDPAFGPSVIGERPGTLHPDAIVVFCAHFDTYNGSNQNDAPGCDDNASGTAAVMMAASILAAESFDATIRFIAFSGEEQWMVGSEAYAMAAEAAGENIVAAINLDMLLHPGWDDHEPDPDYDLDIGGNTSSQWLAQLLAADFAQYTPIDVEVHESDDFVSDQWGFWQAGYDAVGLAEHTPSETWGGANDVYHQPTDTMDNPDIDWPFALHAIRGSMATLIQLAGLAACPADVDGDGDVDFADLLDVIAAWGACADCREDLDLNGVVGFSDVLVLIGAWGPCV
ncbi:MAG: Zn-dependent exopeptidase M28 [Planctomycetes bacterium]|nr:Zn-dependent exopeptidase M28 [Planctomycetota bacterium]